jgi:hypothetical protein
MVFFQLGLIFWEPVVTIIRISITLTKNLNTHFLKIYSIFQDYKLLESNSNNRNLTSTFNKNLLKENFNPFITNLGTLSVTLVTGFQELILLLQNIFLLNYYLNVLSNFGNVFIQVSINLADFSTNYTRLSKVLRNNFLTKYQKNYLKTYTTNQTYLDTTVNQNLYQSQENRTDFRNQRTQNPIFRYDFKLGNYMPEELKRKFPHSFISIHDLTTGLRKPLWANSPEILKFIQADFSGYLFFFSDQKDNVSRKEMVKALSQVNGYENNQESFWANITYTAGFYNFLFNFSSNTVVNQARWVSLNSLEQKFCQMFLTNSMQQRVHANWRELKFTREAWRCRLLSARHQNTLHRRYVDESSTVWAVERNAKDVLPGW